ncbi:MAG: outer membrane protein transport protein [Elusimicrobiota bacterium]|nr:outer membrane protein transport protein [Elusimicrobiota bacterium]
MNILNSKFTAGIILAIFIGFGLCPSVVSSGYEFDGIGAKEVLRGGASIADSSGWTAIYWNPANIGLEKEAGEKEIGMEFRAGGMKIKDPNSIANDFNLLFDKTEVSYPVFSGSLGTAFKINEDYAFGGGIYSPVMQGTDFEGVSSDTTKSIDQKGFTAIAVANTSVSRKITEKLYVGTGINIIYGKLKTESNLILIGGPSLSSGEISGDGYGLEGVFGLSYEFNPNFTMGMVYRTGNHLKFKGTVDAYMLGVPNEKSDFSFTLNHPATSGVGAAWKVNPRTILTMDFTQTYWEGFSNKFVYDNPGVLITNADNTFDWNNSWKIRLGLVRELSEKTDFIAGYAFDVPAIDKGSIDFATAVDVPMHRFSGGIAKKWKNTEFVFGGLFGAAKRNENGMEYKLGGWYFISEIKVKI